MKLSRLGGLLLSTLLLSACVTINIYFPAAQAEEAAGQIVDEIMGNQKPVEEKSGAALQQHPLYQRIAGHVLDFLVPPVHAAQPDFNVNSPAIRKLKASMEQRYGSLVGLYNTGGIGITKDGMITIRDAKAIPLKSRNKAKKLVAAENNDRKALYRAMADANGHPEWASQVQETFSRTWIQKAKRGWWYQTASGWKQK